MLAFFAATPYQLLCAMQLRTQLYAGEQADLYLIEITADLSAYETILKPWFTNVYRTSQPMASFGADRSGLEQLKPFLRPRCDLLPALQRARYSAVFSSRIGLGNAFYMHFIRRCDPDAEFHYYDEGVGNYCATPLVGGKAAPLRKLLGYPDPCADMDGYWLYRPELLRIPVDAPVRAVPPLKPGCEALNAFALTDNDARALDDAQILYFDAPLKEQLGVSIVTDRLSRTLEALSASKRVRVRLHPSQTGTSLAGKAAELPRVSFAAPWEVCPQRRSVAGMTLVALCSTALVTPKLLYDAEPRVALLWKLFQDQWSHTPIYLDFFRSVAQSYRDRSRFCIPETWEQLTEFLSAE